MDCKEVEELLPAYSLSALSAEEEALVEAHLSTCRWCPALLREHMEVAAALAWAAEPVQLSPHLKDRIIRATSKRAAKSRSAGRPLFAPGRRLLGATASIMVLLVAAIITGGLLLANEIDDLQKTNSGLTSQVSRLTATSAQMSNQIDILQEDNSQLSSHVALLSQEDEKLTEMLMEQRSMNYIMTAPEKRVLALHGDDSLTGAQGVLLIAAPEGSGILMAKGLEPSSENTTYHVWLRKDGELAMVGRLLVDKAGWGVLTFWPDEPITLFQQVWVTDEPIQGATKPTGKPVLWGTISPR